MRRSLFCSFLLTFFSLIDLPVHAAPGLQWVKTIGGSGANTVVKAGADSQGNFYIAGNTSSPDFPTTAAAQRNAGSAGLVRIVAGSGASEKLFPPGLTNPTSLAADPHNSTMLYATAGNSLWRSTDAGVTWSILFQFPSDVTVRFLAVDPSNSNNLYIGTNPQGAMKSIDGGLTWTSINNGIPPARDGSAGVYRIWVDPTSPQVIFASATSGLWRSPDAGATWSLTVGSFYVDNTLVFDPFKPGVLYLAGGGSVSMSTDDGQTLTPLSQLPDQSQAAALVADPLHSGVLFAGSYSGIYQSVDSGLTWTRKVATPTSLLAADPNNAVLYADSSTYGIVKSTDGFTTSLPIGPPETSLLQVLVAGSNIFLVSQPSSDVFVVKLDPNGNVVYSTYFGGSANDSASDMAIGADGSIYVTGGTASLDFPVTPGAYASALSGLSSSFVFKLNADGSLGWSTYFAAQGTSVNTVAVDAAGNAYIGGSTNGGLPTTPGAYQTQFQAKTTCTGFIGCFPGPTSAFVTKLNSKGTGLVYSTYVPNDPKKNIVQVARALVIDPSGNAYFGGSGEVVLIDGTGSAVIASAGHDGLNIAALALDASSNVYAAGTWTTGTFPATAGAFQQSPQPATPSLPAQLGAGGVSDAFVMKWDSRLSQTLAATLLGGESTDAAESLAIDGSGNVIISGFTDSKAFPTQAPFQASFAPRTGFVSMLDSSLSHLLFSTYVGDNRAFDVHTAVADSSGNIFLAGSTLISGGGFLGGDPGGSFTLSGIVVANKITVPTASGPRLDSVVNLASRLAAPIAPGEAISAIGSGFGPDAQLVVDGVLLAGSTITGVMPDGSKTSGAYQIQVSTGGTLSNSVLVPAAPASPGLYSVDGSGYGQGHILNNDGTVNSPSNPAVPGSSITLWATGVGPYSLSGGYAVLAQPPSVFIDGFYANGIAAVMAPIAGLPGNVYQISVSVPDPAKLVAQNPNLLNFKMPPQVGVKLVVGTVNPLNPDNSSAISQPGLVLSVKQ